MVDDVEVAVGDAEPQALGVQRAVAHEVADELGELGSDAPEERARDARAVQCASASSGSSDLLGFTDELVERERDAVAGAKVGEAPPHPRAGLVDDLDPVLCRAPQAVAAARPHVDDGLDAVHVELRGAREPLRRSAHRCPSGCHWSPIGSPSEPSRTRPRSVGNERAADEAAGRRQNGGLRVAHAEALAELDGFVPRALCGAQQLRRHELFVDLGRLGRGACATRSASAPRSRRSPRTGPCAPRCARSWRTRDPVMSAVIAPAHARPSSESYGMPCAISSAPRFA